MENVIRKATFDPAVKTYIFLVVVFYLVISFIGLALLPFWLLGLGQWLSKKFFNTLKCEVTEKNLRFAKGIILHVEKTIPLENIQDLSFIGGPVLRAFGLTMIRVETAGGGGKHHSNMMSMIGITDAGDFKDLILRQRETVIREKALLSAGGGKPSERSISGEQLLTEIRNELTEIKNILKEKKSY